MGACSRSASLFGILTLIFSRVEAYSVKRQMLYSAPKSVNESENSVGQLITFVNPVEGRKPGNVLVEYTLNVPP